jgi:hypothetical protein
MQWRVTLVCAAAIFMACSAPRSAFGESGGTLTAEEIINKAVATAQSNHAARVMRDYAYRKVSTTEVLDGKGEVKERKEKVFLIQAGRAVLQQMKCNGEVVSAEQLQKEDRRTSEARQEVTESRSSQRDESWERFLTEELASKYTFSLVGTEEINGRWAYVLTFSPRSDDLPVRRMADRVLNRLAGRIWIDKDEFEIAKARIALQSQATLGGLLKVVGALKRFDYQVERVRLARNVWFNRATQGDFESRKLWDSTRTRILTEASGFQKHHSARN